MSAAGAVDSPDATYEALESYNWDDDVEFQSGLSAILGSGSSPEQAAELTLRARCFYYTRKFNVHVDFDGYKAYRSANSLHPVVTNGAHAPAAASSAESAGGILPTASGTTNGTPAPYPTSFAHIVELVSSGQPVPGIKQIPNTVLTGQGTNPARAKRRKPWEQDDPPAAAQGEQEAAP
ncbi:hypothetical protein BU24DRAFT_451167 [Aaosphaeria arxii CBS 175.79]|uniref:Uncharacterized protein n=1 Tax=Aaosphaeria arxii CBS 175.79 TaxID=1450172 RepID=A0A6A5XUT0_9PLEO|nr:uncharacterized protein BU24DRAFT_451167 [Aaosphaeria arxii CBS 175.79]KAF2016689.1 hypothetical protein BU24DRAFT_451167 [Aaosphaeria arxii CBS 175.79]